MNTSNNLLLDINLHFMCRSAKTYKNGLSPIALRITFRGERREILTGLSCEKNNWFADVQQVNPRSRLAVPTNKELFTILHKVTERFQQLKYSGVDFTIDELVDRIRGKEAPPQSLTEYMDLKMHELQQRIRVDLAVSTFFKYKRAIKYMSEFLLVRRGVRNIAVGSVNGEFLKHFFWFLRKDKKQEHNSAVALMNCLKTILKTPVKNGTIKRNPFDDFPLTQKPVFRNFLELDEIKRLQQLENLNPEQELKRDLFLLACFTGMAYADIKGLKGSDFVTDPDGTQCIRDSRQKTGIVSIIPLLPVAQDIFRKYSLTGECRDFQWRVMSNQKLNSGLKEIARKAGIDKPIFMHLGRHTFATTVTLSHGVPLETVSKMLGHSTIKHTQLYAKIVATKVKTDMGKIAHLFT